MKRKIQTGIAVFTIGWLASGCIFVQKDAAGERLQTALLLYLLVESEQNKNSTKSPTITITNNSGNPESYLMYTTACTGGPTYEFSNPFSNGSTTETLTISAGSYYISVFLGCTSSALTFENGVAYSCSSDGSNISCTGTSL